MLTYVTLGLAQESSTTPSENRNQEDIRGSDKRDPDQDQPGYHTSDLLITDRSQGEMPKAEGSQTESEEATPIPIWMGEETKSLGAQAYVDDVFQSKRNLWGFSVSALQAYTSALYEGDQPNQSAGITAFMPRVFFNFGKRKSQFHVDLGAGYRRYNRAGTSNSWDYYGSTGYSEQISNRVSFYLSDQFTSSYNDSWSFLSLYSPITYDPNFSNEVLFNRQRITQNSFRADLSSQLTRKMRFDVFGDYNRYNYSINSLGNANAYEAGASLDYQVTKWLYLTNSYSAYLNQVDEQFRDARIHRLQVMGLDFHLTHSWRLWAGGGAELADYQGEYRLQESINSGIGYTARETTFSITYQRGFTSAIGLSTLLTSDIVGALLGHRITSWMRGSLQSYYYRSSELNSNGLLRTFSNGAELEFALRRDLVASVSASYQNQNTNNFSIQGLGINRLTEYVGLQYFWPSRNETPP